MKDKNLQQHPGRGWLTKAEISAAFDVCPQHFDRHYRRFVAPDAQKMVGRTLYFLCASVVKAWGEHHRAASTAATDDMLLAGADSPALERYRAARADITEIERDRLRENLVPRDVLGTVLRRLDGPLRRAAARLERTHGPDAGAMLREAVDEWELGVDQLLGEAE